MSFCLCTGAVLQCPFGSVPAPFSALPLPRVVINGRPAGVMTDMAPTVNLPPFGMCSMDNVNAGTFNGTDLGPGKRSGIEAFQEITDVSIMAVPGVTDANVQAKLIAHCEGLTSRFAVLDAPLNCTAVDELNRHRSAYDTSYAALYVP